jgi:hypothetical protein
MSGGRDGDTKHGSETMTTIYLSSDEVRTSERVYCGTTKARLRKVTRDLYEQIRTGATDVRRGRSAELLLIAGRSMDRHLAGMYAAA